jgi:hypothetical protein
MLKVIMNGNKDKNVPFHNYAKFVVAVLSHLPLASLKLPPPRHEIINLVFALSCRIFRKRFVFYFVCPNCEDKESFFGRKFHFIFELKRRKGGTLKCDQKKTATDK